MPARGRRPVHKCKIAGLIERCHVASGNEAACALCNLIDFESLTTMDALGRYPNTDALGTVEQVFWAHLARRTDGGPSNAAELHAWNRRRRDKWDRDTDRRVRLAVAEQSPLPDEPPF